MGDGTGIEWTDATWNPLRGCSKVSAGCKFCYAESVAKRFSGTGQPYDGTIGENGKWNGKIRLVPEHLADPIRWTKPRMIFVNSMSDLFHENVSFEYVAAVFGVMAAAQRHTFQVLTKRPERMLEFFRWVAATARDASVTPHYLVVSCAIHAGVRGKAELDVYGQPWPLPNVWLGVSAENQATANERIPLLLQCPAVVRWVSAEPLLGPIDFDRVMDDDQRWRSLRGTVEWEVAASSIEHDGGIDGCTVDGLDWVVVGGESGPDARQMHPQWARSICDQCSDAGVPFLFKQWGEWAPHEDGEFMREDPNIVIGGRPVRMKRVGKKAAGRILDGRVCDGYPR